MSNAFSVKFIVSIFDLIEWMRDISLCLGLTYPNLLYLFSCRLMARREKDREERQQVIAGTSGRDRPTPLPNRPQVAPRKSVRAVPSSSDAGES